MSANFVKLTGAACAGVVAAGLLVGAPPAAAAPQCDAFIHPATMTLRADNGSTINLYEPDGKEHPGASHDLPGTPTLRGSSNGTRQGNKLYFRINWDNGTSNTFTGEIGDDLVARGTTTSSTGGPTNSWEDLTKWTCKKNPAPIVTPEPKAPEPNVPQPDEPPPVQTNLVSVTADVDAYTQPGGVGKPIGILRGGQKVTLLERRADNWCHVTGDGVPGGTAWVWGDFIS